MKLFRYLLFISLLIPVSLAGQRDDRRIPESYLKDPQKPVVVMFTASWCGPCKMLKSDILQHPDVKPMLQQVNLLMMDTDTAEGKRYQKAFGYENQGIPLLVLMDKEQNVIADYRGYNKDVSKFIEFLNKGLKP